MCSYPRVPLLVLSAVTLALLASCGEEASPAGANVADTAAGPTDADAAAGADADAQTAADTVTSGDQGQLSADAPDAAAVKGAACPADQRVGRFEVLQDSVYGGSVSGNVADRIDALQLLVAKESQGSCTLFQRKAAVCSPSCTGQQQCVRDQGCQAFPAPIDVGKVEIAGLVKPVSMSPKGANKDYFFTDFDADPAAPMADLKLTASGGQVAAFSLLGKASPPLLVQNTSATLTKGKALSLNWTPAAANAFVLRLSLNVDQHGLTPVTLVCETADTGAFTVPVALTDALMNYGISGAATATLERLTVDSTLISLPAGGKGCVELIAASRVALQVLAQ